MEPEINLNLNDLRVVREKQDRDVLVGMVFGASAVLSLTLTAMLGVRFLNTGKPGPVAALIALTLIGSVASYFAAKRDERWFVLCSILNHMGIGLGLFLLRKRLLFVASGSYSDTRNSPVCSLLPACWPADEYSERSCKHISHHGDCCSDASWAA
jgi:hypothetical protein